jgi:hypothetical protein
MSDNVSGSRCESNHFPTSKVKRPFGSPCLAGKRMAAASFAMCQQSFGYAATDSSSIPPTIQSRRTCTYTEIAVAPSSGESSKALQRWLAAREL